MNTIKLTLRYSITIILMGLVCTIALCAIGLPSRLVDRNISSRSLKAIESANQILLNYQKTVVKSREESYMPDNFGYLTSKSNLKDLFKELPENDLKKINALLNTEVGEIDMSSPGCIVYFIKSSFNGNDLLYDSWESFYLVYKRDCQCECENGRGDNYTKEVLDSSWFKLYTINRRQWFWQA